MSAQRFKLPPERLSSSTSRRQVLALSGGGYRGLFTSIVLEHLEGLAKRPLRELFDLFAGTSIGGIIASALAVGVPATDIRREFEKHGTRIFDSRARLGSRRLPWSNPARRLFVAQYETLPLEAAILEIVGGPAAGRPLAEIDTPLLLTAVSQTLGAPRLFRSAGLAGAEASPERLLDAALATAAAPTFFPPHRLGQEDLVDGGLIANAPDLVGLTEAMDRYGCAVEDVHLLSVGTAGAPRADRPRPSGRAGLLGWLLARGLVQLTLGAQEALAVQTSHKLLGPRLLRIDATPSKRQAAVLGLDRADREATATLELLAGVAIRELTPTNRHLRSFLEHVASP